MIKNKLRYAGPKTESELVRDIGFLATLPIMDVNGTAAGLRSDAGRIISNSASLDLAYKAIDQARKVAHLNAFGRTIAAVERTEQPYPADLLDFAAVELNRHLISAGLEGPDLDAARKRIARAVTACRTCAPTKTL